MRAVTFTVHPQRFSYVENGLPGGVSARAPLQPPATTAPVATATPGPADQHLQVSVTVTPSEMVYGDHPTVTIHTAPQASCRIKVFYTETGSQGPVQNMRAPLMPAAQSQSRASGIRKPGASPAR